MIRYRSGGRNFVLKIFQLHGSVFPQAGAIALPCAALAALMRLWIDAGFLPFLKEEGQVLKESQAWSGFSFLIGFLIVFRTSQSYNRFWDGLTAVHRMQAEWFDSASALVAFTSMSQASLEEVSAFKHEIVRLLSLLHAAALGHLEHDPSESEHNIATFSYELLDPESLDVETRKKVKNSGSRCELIFTWVQIAIVQNHASGVLNVAPPILSRTFQTLANGMIAFHDSTKIADTPFPFPYAQTCDFLLVLHWLISPFVFSQFSLSPLWAMCFCFVQVFVFWALNLTAVEIENPFGTDANDIDGHTLQHEMNCNLRYLLHEDVLQTPQLNKKFRGALNSLGGNAEFENLMTVMQRSKDLGTRSTQLGNNSSQLQLPHSMSAQSTDRSSKLNDAWTAANTRLRSSFVALQQVASGDLGRPEMERKGHGQIIDAMAQWRDFDKKDDDAIGFIDPGEMGLSQGLDADAQSGEASGGPSLCEQETTVDIVAKEAQPQTGPASRSNGLPAGSSLSINSRVMSVPGDRSANPLAPNPVAIKTDFRIRAPPGGMLSADAGRSPNQLSRSNELTEPSHAMVCVDPGAMMLSRCCVEGHGTLKEEPEPLEI